MKILSLLGVLTVVWSLSFTYLDLLTEARSTSICDQNELCDINKRLDYLEQFSNGEVTCGLQHKKISCKISQWAEFGLIERIKMSLSYVNEIKKIRKEIREEIKIDSRVFICLKSKESPLFEPAGMNPNACNRKSTANGISSITKTAAKAMFEDSEIPFLSVLEEYSDVTDSEEFFNLMAKDVRLQTEAGLFFLDMKKGNKSYHNALKRYRSWPSIDPEKLTAEKVIKNKKERALSERYANQILNCSSCLESVLDEAGELLDGQTNEELLNCLNLTNSKMNLQENFDYYSKTICQK